MYQIYCDRGNGLALDGCWGSDCAKINALTEARSAAKHLAEIYPDCDWVVCDAGKQEINRYPAQASAARQDC